MTLKINVLDDNTIVIKNEGEPINVVQDAGPRSQKKNRAAKLFKELDESRDGWDSKIIDFVKKYATEEDARVYAILSSDVGHIINFYKKHIDGRYAINEPYERLNFINHAINIINRIVQQYEDTGTIIKGDTINEDYSTNDEIIEFIAKNIRKYDISTVSRRLGGIGNAAIRNVLNRTSTLTLTKQREILLTMKEWILARQFANECRSNKGGAL